MSSEIPLERFSAVWHDRIIKICGFTLLLSHPLILKAFLLALPISAAGPGPATSASLSPGSSLVHFASYMAIIAVHR